jgi:transposase-like protein
MSEPNPISEKSGVTFQPPCPRCGSPMWLVRLDPHDEGHDLRSFECKVCDHSESKVVQFKQA